MCCEFFLEKADIQEKDIAKTFPFQKLLNFLLDFRLLGDHLHFLNVQFIPGNQKEIGLLQGKEYPTEQDDVEKNMFEFQFDLPLDFFRLDLSLSALELHRFSEEGMCSVPDSRIEVIGHIYPFGSSVFAISGIIW
jgi:hypothetical protein